ncbi:MAG: adenylyl-sulfate kinase [Flavobacteriales bacterium]
MKETGSNLFTVFDELLERADKERLLGQRSKAIWMTGLSGSGKTTIAKGVENLLYKKGYLIQVLDGDNVRTGINNDLGFSQEDRRENIRRIAEINKLLLHCGVITINCFVSPTKDIRAMARDIIGEEDFLEVFIDAGLEVCEKRDPKGLYRRARAGEIRDFTGIDAPFEAPANPALSINTSELSIEDSVQRVLEFVLPLIEKKS